MVNDVFAPIGNDIVDLKTEEPPLHKRYKNYAFTKKECMEIGESRTKLWLHWAAKEAAYKALKQLDPALSFRPKHFQYSIEKNVVTLGSQALFCRSHISSQYIHVICTTKRDLLWSIDLKGWVSRFPVDQNCQDSNLLTCSSRSVREVAIKKIASTLRLPLGALKIDTSRANDSASTSNFYNWSKPPLLLIYGAKTSHALSLSHHGRYVAVAFLRQYKAHKESRINSDSRPCNIPKSFIAFNKEDYERRT